VAENDRAGVAPWGVVARLRLGEALIHRERPDAARDALQEAAARAETLEMAAPAAAARRLLGALVA